MQIKVYVFKDIRFISDLCSITCLFLIALVAAGLKGHCPLVAEPEARDLGWTTGSTSGASSASLNFGLAHLKSVFCFALAAVVVPQLGAGGRLLFSDQ